MKELKGIDWYNIKTDETVYTRRPAQIKALIESSDLGVNRQSDRGWRIGAEWYKKLRAARNDRQFMEKLYEKYGEDVSDSNALVALFQREERANQQNKRYEDEAPFEQKYQDSLKTEPVSEPKVGRPSKSSN
jgi:hypothetical protein